MFILHAHISQSVDRMILKSHYPCTHKHVFNDHNNRKLFKICHYWVLIKWVLADLTLSSGVSKLVYQILYYVICFYFFLIYVFEFNMLSKDKKNCQVI